MNAGWMERPAAGLSALGWAALALLAPLPGAAQDSTAPARACTAPADMTPAALYGLWQVTLWAQDAGDSTPASTGALVFERHPEYPGSVRGKLQRPTLGGDLHALVSGDVTDGAFHLDESADGVAMDAVWEGDVSPAGCGLEIRGIRRPAEGRPAGEAVLNFLLKKAPGWR